MFDLQSERDCGYFDSVSSLSVDQQSLVSLSQFLDDHHVHQRNYIAGSERDMSNDVTAIHNVNFQ